MARCAWIDLEICKFADFNQGFFIGIHECGGWKTVARDLGNCAINERQIGLFLELCNTLKHACERHVTRFNDGRKGCSSQARYV